MSTTQSTLKTRTQNWWDARSAREQTLLKSGAAVGGLLLWWLLLIDPALSSVLKQRNTLAARMEKAAQTLALAQAVQVQGTGRRSGAPVTAQEADGLIKDLLRTQSWGASAVTQPLDGQLEVRVREVPASALLVWLDDVNRQTGWQAREVSLERGQDPTATGLLEGRLLLGPKSP